MRKTISVALIAAMITACGAKEEAVMDSATAMITARTPTMADFAGTWSMLAILEGTPEKVHATFASSADSSAWTLSFKDRPDVSVHVMVVGDSLIGESDPYESVLRSGVTVSLRTASALTSPVTMQGSMIATYATPTGEEKVAGTTSSTRAP